MRDMLDAIFPGHGIDPGARGRRRSRIARRQMVEIARAFTVTDTPARLVILDEPTSSLDSVLAGQLLAHVRRFTADGGSVVLISHLLGEILGDRRPHRRDARRPGRRARRAPPPSTAPSLVRAMGSVVPRGGAEARRPPCAPTAAAAWSAPARAAAPTRASSSPTPARSSASAASAATARPSSCVQVFDRADGAEVAGPVALVAGDRQSDGIFPLWSIAANITIASLAPLPRRARCSTRAASAPSPRTGASSIGIRTPDIGNPILSLSGGNQQKALFARALGSDARIVVMDDPMRGVDVGTKQEVYAHDPRRGGHAAAPSSGTPPRWTSSPTATTSTSSARARSSPTSRAPR